MNQRNLAKHTTRQDAPAYTYALFWFALLAGGALLWAARINWAKPFHGPYDPNASRFYWDFTEDPAQPQSWSGQLLKETTWDITVHNQDARYWESMEPMKAQHGPNCDPPPQTVNDHLSNHPHNGVHLVDHLDNTVYICNGHLMTALNASGYGMIYMTPPYMADWSEQEAVVKVNLSTARLSGRDFVDVWITPYEENLQLALNEAHPDVAGEPRRALHAELDLQVDGPWRPAVVRNHERIEFNPPWEYLGVEAALAQIGLQPDFRRRDTFEFRIRPDRFSLTMIAEGQAVLLFDEPIDPPLDWHAGVVQFGHHSHNPWQDGGLGPNTWHWDEFEIQPAIPFTIIGSDRRFANEANRVINFDKPSPDESYLRFTGIGNELQFSIDGGSTWFSPKLQQVDERLLSDERFKSYWTPIPAGVTSVQFRGQPWFGGEWHVRDVSVWNAPNKGDKDRPKPNPVGDQPQQPVVTNPVNSPEAAGKKSIRINTGSDQLYVDQFGQTWEADRGFIGGNIGIHSELTLKNGESPIHGVERWGLEGYQIPLQNGRYDVVMHLTENYSGISGPNQRLFSADIEGSIIENIDPFALTGGRNMATTRQTTVDVIDGQLDIRFMRIIQEPMLNGIEIHPVSSAENNPVPDPTPLPGIDGLPPTPDPAPTDAIRINAAATEPYVDQAGNLWEADRGFIGGNVVQRPADMIFQNGESTIFRNERWSMAGYEIPLENGGYTIDLLFAEGYAGITGPGQRVFSIDLEGTLIPHLDVFAEAGGREIVISKRQDVMLSDGMLNIKFMREIENPMINGIVITPNPAVEAGRPSPIDVAVVPDSTQAIRINVGAEQPYVDSLGQLWEADRGYLDGTVKARPGMQIENGDSPIYSTERYGLSGYSLPVPDGNYFVELHFSENYQGIQGNGQRLFSVDIEGRLLSGLDIYAVHGRPQVAHVVTKLVTVEDGQLDLRFTAHIQNSMIHGIVITPAVLDVQPVP